MISFSPDHGTYSLKFRNFYAISYLQVAQLNSWEDLNYEQRLNSLQMADSGKEGAVRRFHYDRDLIKSSCT